MQIKNKKEDYGKVEKLIKIKIALIVILFVVIVGLIFFVSFLNNTKNDQFWNVEGKKAEEYTLEEFQKLTDEQKVAFSKEFKGNEFDEWMTSVQSSNNQIMPWEKDGKKVSEYTWEEFEKLTDEQKMLFSKEFKEDEFNSWMNKVNVMVENESLWSDDKKKPNDYTWEEFEKLTFTEQMIFQNSFEDSVAFEKWMNEALQNQNVLPLESEKQLSDFTWEEFNSLTGAQQIIFQNKMGEKEFYNWYLENYPVESNQ